MKKFIAIGLLLFALGCGDTVVTTCPPPDCPTCPAPEQPQLQLSLTSWFEPDHFVIHGTTWIGEPNMLSLPAKFKSALLQKNKPNYILKVVESEIQNEQTSQTQWAANSGESNVDYTPTPPAAGDVILSAAYAPDQENLVGNTWDLFSLYGPNDESHWQSFQHAESGARKLDKVNLYLKGVGYQTSHYNTVVMEIWSAGKVSKLSSSQSVNVGNGSAEAWFTFYFTNDGLSLQPSTEYWIKFYLASTSLENVYFKYQNTSVYASGQYDKYITPTWSLNLGDLMFEVQFLPIYQSSGYIQTQIMDMGSVPTVDGLWRFETLTPQGTSVQYEAWAIDDFLTWTSRTIPTGTYTAITWNGLVFAAVGLSVAATSPDGITWTSRTIPAGDYYNVAWNGSVFAAVGVSVAATSPDGITWTSRTIPAGTYQSVAWNGTVFAAVGNSVAATSPDGITWTSRTIPAGTYGAVAWNGSVFSAVGINVAATSPDGITWTSRTIPAGTYQSVAWNGTVFAAVGNSVAATSPDGITWTSRTIPAGTYYGIAWNGIFTAVGLSVAATSPDGITWTSRTIPAGTYNGVAWDSSVFVAVGTNVAASTTATSLGTVIDGQAITVRSRYYAVKATLTADASLNYTPTVKSIMTRFPIYLGFSDNTRLGYEAALQSVSAFSQAIDDFKPSAVGQVQATLDHTWTLSNWLSLKYPKNKEAKILIGFDDPVPFTEFAEELTPTIDETTFPHIYEGLVSNFTEADYLQYYTGIIKDWNITEKDQVTLKIDDLHIEWDAPVPRQWASTLDDVVWTDAHPADVMVDIIQSFVTSYYETTRLRGYISINQASFNTVKSSTVGWQVSRTITGSTAKARDLLDELRQTLSCYFMPLPGGDVKLKQWDADEVAVMEITDRDFITKKWEANAGSLINRTAIYYEWIKSVEEPTWYASVAYKKGDYIIPTTGNGRRYECTTAGTSGGTEPTWGTTVGGTTADNTATWTCRHSAGDDELRNYLASDVYVDVPSVFNYGELATKIVKDKWTRQSQIAQVQARRDNLIGRYKDPAEKITATVDMRFFELEPGDMVSITTKRAPSFSVVLTEISETLTPVISETVLPEIYEGLVLDMPGIAAKKFQIISKQPNFQNHTIGFTFLRA